ncbi:hypothetical protein N0B31_20020 [Salinirubellus salinus]|uniref:DUF8163 domain-containing protein n=1 Tax=Salinirubellus salinus TaxID=1364945 RepID=A0A9E7UAT8_9EURY|nr:hypothetical protein [Salinirubellus salinus]UWM54392.1 hypothetical protein N0B31_20020 [Salinirubellus salinus]
MSVPSPDQRSSGWPPTPRLTVLELAGAGVFSLTLAVTVDQVWLAAGVGVLLLTELYGGEFGFLFGSVVLGAAGVADRPWVLLLTAVGLLSILVEPAVLFDEPRVSLPAFVGGFLAIASTGVVWTVLPWNSSPTLSIATVVGYVALVGAILVAIGRWYEIRVLPARTTFGTGDGWRFRGPIPDSEERAVDALSSSPTAAHVDDTSGGEGR